MREILFRAKRIDNGEWVEGDLSYIVHDKKRMYVFPAGGLDSADRYEVYPETLCQYTGLKDKNGKRIWENDIVSGYFNHKKITGFIKYGSNAVYYIEREGSYGIHLDNSEDWLEVIGNIFDNPELLKGGLTCRN